MTAGTDHTLVELHPAERSLECDSRRALDITGIPHRRVESKGELIRSRDLYLVAWASRADDPNPVNLTLGPDEVDLLLASKLPRLRDLPIRSQCVALPKQPLDHLLGEVNMPCRHRNRNARRLSHLVPAIHQGRHLSCDLPGLICGDR